MDGAPANYSTMAREWVSHAFNGRWIGRLGELAEWPARSPDMTPCDHFLWGYVKDETFKLATENLKELKDAILLELCVNYKIF